MRLLQLRRVLTRHLRYPRRNHRYSVAQMILALIYPIVLVLDRLETASFLRFNSTFQYLTGLPSFPDPQTLRRFLLPAPAGFRQHWHHLNDRLLQQLIHLPQHRSRLLLDPRNHAANYLTPRAFSPRPDTVRATEVGDPRGCSKGEVTGGALVMPARR